MKTFFVLAALLFIGLGLLGALFPEQIYGQGLVPCGNPGQPGCTVCHTFSLLKNILDIFLFPTVPIIAALLIAVGGFFLFTGAASPQNINRGRTIIFAVVIGLLIIYGSWLFINLLLDSLGVTIWTGPGTWWQVQCSVPFPFQGILYGVAGSELYIIESGTDNIQTVGSLGVSGGDYGLAYNSRTHTFYAVDGNGTGDLLAIDPATGASQVVGNLNDPTAGGDPGLAYDQNTNTLFIASDAPTVALHTVDMTTGQATFVGNLGAWGNSNMGLAFDPITNTLYAVSSSQGIFKVSTTTGVATNICAPQSTQATGLAFHHAEGLLYVVDDVDKKIYRLDPATCAVTDFADFTAAFNLEGIDFR